MNKIKVTLKEYQILSLCFSQYNWKEINIQLYKNDWKKFESNNKTYMCHIYHIIFYTYDTILEK